MTRRWGALAGACITLLVTAACGGGSPTSPGAPGGGGSGETLATFTGSVPAYGIVSHEFTASASGAVVVTLTWTGAGDLDLYVTAAGCTGYPPDACSILARSTTSSGTTESVTLTATAGTPWRLWVDNFSPAASFTYTLVVRRG